MRCHHIIHPVSYKSVKANTSLPDRLLGQGSYKDSDSGPAVRIAAAGVHPHQNDVAPGSAAETTTVTVTEIPVTKAVAPCTQRGPHHSIVTHGVPVFGFELHRRGEDSDDIPSYLKPGELGTPYPASIMGASVGPTSPTAYPCDSGPCPMGFVRYLWADLCMCVWNPSMKTTSSTIR